MTDKALNPFRPTRWEHHSDGRPLIWFSETADSLSADKSAYVYGSRGSGKTSLLKGICWEDLCFNESLQLQRRLLDFRHVGIYIRFPDHISSSMATADWKLVLPSAPDPDYEYHKFFSLALELICAERTLDTCHSLRLLSAVAYTPGAELRVVEDFIEEFPEICSFAAQQPRTYLDLGRVLRQLVRRMNEACGQGSVQDLLKSLPPREPYQVLSYLVERISAGSRMPGHGRNFQVAFKYCLDDCEVLSPIQRKSLNTVVRVSRSPISWVISSVGTPQDDSETFLISQPLTDADRRVLSLDERDRADFRELCQSVVSLRLLFALPAEHRQGKSTDQISAFFSLEDRLGRRDVNDLMYQMARKSNRPLSKIVMRAAELLASDVRLIDRKIAENYSPKQGRLPMYEAYTLLHWRGREDAFRTDFGDEELSRLRSLAPRFRDQAFMGWLRRKQQNALLHFSSTLRVRRIPFAGANIIMSLSDSSIRDFLEIMGEIYDAYVVDRRWDRSEPTNLERFASSRTQIASAVQTTGIYAASDAYLDGIARRPEIDADVVARLINGLGHLTSFLQSNPSDPRVFGSTERGVFLVDYPKEDGASLSFEDRFVHAALKQAELAGYLRPVEAPRAVSATQPGGTAKVIAHRLHRRFAPHFRFSFRGPYELVRISSKDIAALCLRPESLSAFAWAKGMAGISDRPGEPQIALPLAEADTDD